MELQRLRTLLESGNSFVRLVTYEEPEVLDLALACAAALRVHPWVWSATGGLRPASLRHQKAVDDTLNPAAAMVWLRAHIKEPSMCIMLDLGDHLDDKHTTRALRELAEHFRAGGENMELADRAWIVMIDHRADVPLVIEAISRRHDISPPGDEEIEQLVRSTLKRMNSRRPLQVKVPRKTFARIMQTLRGLSRRQVQQVIADSVGGDGEFSEHDLAQVIEGKRRLIKSAGVLEFVDRPNSMDEVGGLRRLKRWLAQREPALSEEGRNAGLDAPRGILLLGVQGAGKSVAAKAIAAAWQRPLMRLDPGVLYDRYVGESERRLREALRQAEAMAPVVLWIDEIEKGFASAASQSTDGGLSQRMFGTLLTWMQDRTAPVFLVATANNIDALPPELLRKGRFDEIFFVDLPDEESRAEIVRIHLKRRGHDPASFDIARLVQCSAGCGGAEIEQAVISGMYAAFAGKRAMTTEDVVRAMSESSPLSVTMRERIDALRAWSRGRCALAD